MATKIYAPAARRSTLVGEGNWTLHTLKNGNEASDSASH